MNLPVSPLLHERDETCLAPPPARWPISLLARLVPRPFRPELEDEYRRWRFARSLGTWRTLLASGCLAFGAFTLWDYVVAPDQYLLLVPVRILFCGLLMALWVATYDPEAQRRLTRDMGVMVACYSLGIAWILSVVPDGWRIGLTAYAFPLLFLMVIPQARLMAAQSTATLLLANGSLWLCSAEPVTWASANFFLLGLSGMAYILAFVNEARDRHLFELERHLVRLATVDELSGAWNRRHFTHLAEAELRRASRYHRAVSLLILDIDHFKRINDTFGHPVGDEAIRILSATCRQALRQSDALGRLGGEEFAVLLPETDPEAATTIAERLRADIADIRLPLDSQPEPLQYTASIGVATAGRDDSFTTLFRRADSALYLAKSSGRNRVVVAGAT